MRLEGVARLGVLLVCAALVAWVRLLPISPAGLATPADEAAREGWLYRGDDDAAHVYLGDYDSYLWLRHARGLLERGTSCGAIGAGRCLDTATHAPVGREDRYAGSTHALAIAAVHRLTTWLRPGYPLPSSSFLVPVLVGILGVLPAFALGQRVGGALGGAAAALIVGLNHVFLVRSAGSDNDVWNVVLPLFALWAVIGALDAHTRGRRLALATIAGLLAALHAATWSGWVFHWAIELAGLAATALVLGLRVMLRRLPSRSALLDTVVVALVFYLGTGIGVTIVRRDGSYWTLPAQAFASLPAVELASGDTPSQGGRIEAPWPNALDTVGELKRFDLAQTLERFNGRSFFLLSLAGLLVLALPRRGWGVWHLAVLLGGVGLGWYLVGSGVSRPSLVALLALPIGAGLLLSTVSRDEVSPADLAMGVIASTLYLAALLLADRGQRFLLLLVPPFGLACAAAIGAAGQAVQETLDRRLPLPPIARRLLNVALFAGFAAILLRPVERGRDAAREYRPQMNDAWWDTFVDLRRTSPADAILHTWWDRGYWAAYAAERRVEADGGSLRTHLPHWFGRALLAADERESAGLFRMLDCGSDAIPEPEGRSGAYAKLVAHGVDPVVAPAWIADLARLDREAASQLLAARGLDGAARTDVLASTHCEAPPGYVILGSHMVENAAWRRQGGWSFERALAVRLAREPAAEATQQLRDRFGLDEATAAEMMEEARALGGEEEVRDFISPPSVYLSADWTACRPRGDEGDLECPLPPNPRRLGRFLYRAAAPEDSELTTRMQPGREFANSPAVVVVAGESQTRLYEVDAPTLPKIGVLLDLPQRRILLGSPALVASVFTRLVYLDGRTVELFEKSGERQAADGERVTVWRIRP